MVKFNAEFDEGVFVRYSSTSKDYRVYNHRTASVEESIRVAFNESSPQKTEKDIFFWCFRCDNKKIDQQREFQRRPYSFNKGWEHYRR